MKKKIIFIAQALWIGGIESSLINLLNQIDFNRYEVTCLILHDETEMTSHIFSQCRLIISDRERCVSFSEPYHYRRIYHLIQRPLTSSKLRLIVWRAFRIVFRGFEMDRYAAYVRNQLKDEKFDVCVIYSDRTAEVAVKAVKADHYLMYYHHGAMRREFHDYYGYCKSEKIIAVSEELAKKLRKYRPRYARKIVSIHNLVDYDRVREMSREETNHSFSKTCFNIVSVGRIAEEKGMDLAVRACGYLVQKRFRSFHWWIVGDGPQMKELRQQISEMKLEQYITLTGMQINPYPYIREADLYVQPSRVESFGLTIMEAAILKKPIVSTTTDGAKEIIKNDVNGLLCSTEPNEIAEMIRELAHDSERLNQYQNYWNSFDFEAYNRNQMSLFNQMIEP